MNKKLATMLTSLIIALSVVGAAYAMWSETLILTGTINTGTVGVDWSLHGTGDNEAKDVSGITAVIDNELLIVTITNAYPCVTYWVDFDVHCTGSVPVHIAIFGPEPQLDGLSIELFGQPPYQLHRDEMMDGRLEFHMLNEYGYAQGETYTFTYRLVAHQYNEALLP